MANRRRRTATDMIRRELAFRPGHIPPPRKRRPVELGDLDRHSITAEDWARVEPSLADLEAMQKRWSE